MNFLFISPGHPVNFYKYCTELKNLNCNVFGIGDRQTRELSPELCSALTEYVHVDSLGNYEDVLNSAKYLIRKYGLMSGLESNNEYWLELDARLRRDLDIEGALPDQIEYYIHKSKMKEKFTSAGAAVSPYVVTRLYSEAEAFANKYHYPIFAKPDRGIGARSVSKISDANVLHDFFSRQINEDFIFEVYLDGNLYSYDGLTDKNGNIIFDAAHYFETPIDKLKNTGSECIYHTMDVIPEKLQIAGSSSVRAFGLKGRFFHIEFFELTRNIKDVGNVGDFVALEANMRSSGGLTMEMINAAKNINVFELWAKCMLNFEVPPITSSSNLFCTNVGRHSWKQYKYGVEKIIEKFPDNFVLFMHTSDDPNPFGNDEIIGKFKILEDCKTFDAMLTE